MDEDGENSELDALRVLSAAPLPPLPVLSSASPSAARSSLSSVYHNKKLWSDAIYATVVLINDNTVQQHPLQSEYRFFYTGDGKN